MRFKGLKLSWLLFGGVLQGVLAQAELPEHCSDATVQSVQAPIEKGSDKTFKFFYQKIIKHQNPNKPIFILIPGGPGGVSMTDLIDPATVDEAYGDSTEMYWGLPSGSNIILTDPRSRGCNGENNLSKSTYKTENVVQDLLAVLRKEKLKNYVIVGHSYGTLVATRLVYQIEQKNIERPKAVLLAGVLGKNIDNETSADSIRHAWGQLYNSLPEKVKNILPSDVVSIKDSEDFKFPWGLETQSWLSFIVNGLQPGRNYLFYEKKDQFQLKQDLLSLQYIGTSDLLKRQTLDLLKRRISWYDQFASKEMTPNVLEHVGDESDIQKSSFYSQIWFSEVMNDPERSHLTTNPLNFFDSANYQIESPVIYLQGDLDIQTNVKIARYHYENQRVKGNKFFILGDEGGHDILPALNDCKVDFWQAVTKKKFSKLPKMIRDCYSDLSIVR